MSDTPTNAAVAQEDTARVEKEAARRAEPGGIGRLLRSGAGHNLGLVLALALLAVIGFYSRAISPALPPRCRFHPTCSAYAAEAIERHGAARGSWLALRRILKCAPWHPGGLDPVPPRRPGRGTDAVPAAGPDHDPPGAGGPPADRGDRTAPRGAAAPTSEEQASC